jgi:hypothetical protein
VAAVYLGLAAALAVGMDATFVERDLEGRMAPGEIASTRPAAVR